MLIDWLPTLFKPLFNLVGEIHTSEEEKLVLKNDLKKAELEITAQVLTLQSHLLQSQTQIITAEANGQSWGQRNWRPITMLTFLVLIICDSFGFLAFRLSNEAWELLKIGLGGYVIGRSAEKVIPDILKQFKKGKPNG